MDVSHALTIIIKGKTLAGPALKTAGDQVAKLATSTSKVGVALALLGSLGVKAFKVGLALPAIAAKVALGLLGAALATVLGLVVSVTVSTAALAAGIVSLTSALSVGILKLTEYAAELELMRRAMWGIAGEAMPAMLEALREASAFMVTEQGLLRQYHMAYMLLGKDLAERLPEALQYLTKVSGATGDSVEFLMDRLVRSVGRLSTRWMAYIGTVVTLQEAEVKAAEMFGKTTDELSRQEKMAGMLELTLQKLAARTSVMPEVLGTVRQMSLALKASWKDLWGDVTSHFLPVAQALFKVLLRLVDVFKRLISKGGALYRPIRTVAAAFTVLYEILGDLLGRALEVEEGATSALERFADRVISLAWKAVQWGSNIAVNLAIGIIRGASVALIGAMNFISSLLARWLAPGSAPLVVSNILDWGASAFTEFLRGFSMADFDVIESVQAPLKRALAILVDLGEMGAKAAGEYFINLSEMMAEAITTGNLEEVFAKLGEIPGGYGESLVELFRRQIDLATAVEILAKAEERLAAARKNEEATGKQLSKQAREYNKLAREGADPAILAAKLAEVKASYESLVLAREETEEAEDAVDEASEAIKLAREQVRLQERLLNQLIAMGEAFADLVRPGEDDEEPFVIPEIEWPEGYLLPIDEAFEALKERIRAKFAELWADLRRQWEESGVVEWMARVKEAWEQSSLKTWWDEFWADVKEGGLAYALGELWNKILEGAPLLQWVVDQWEASGLKTWWDEFWADVRSGGLVYALGELWDKFLEAHPTLSATLDWLSRIWETFKGWVTDAAWPWVLTQWDAWSAWWDKNGPGIATKLRVLRETFSGWVADEAWPFVLEQWDKWAAFWDENGQGIIDWLFGIGDQPWSWKNLWAWVVVEWDKWVAWWEEDGPVIVEAIKAIGTALGDLVAPLVDLSLDFWMWVTGERGWKGVWEEAGKILTFFTENSLILMEGWMAQLRNYITLIAQILTGDWEGAWETMQEVSTTTADTINRLTKGKFLELMKIMGGGAQDTVDEVRRAYGIHSESSVFRGIGEAVVAGFANAVRNLPHRAADAILEGVGRIKNAGHQLIDSLRDAITSRAHEIADALRRLVQAAIEAFKRAWGLGSPSTVMVNFGETLAESVALGIERFEDKPAIAIQRMIDLTTATGFKPKPFIEPEEYATGFKPRPFIEPGGLDGYATGHKPQPSIPPVIIHNHFGRDSIRSAQDVTLMADQIQKSLELQGVRARIN